ncbi:hypothetical protein ACFE04_011062 [Oxalis oulophora]
MGAESSSIRNETITPHEEEEEEEVILNIYDLTPINGYTIWFGFGIFHSGIQVHGKEYGFGAHDFPVSGVFEVEPKNCPGFTYRCSLPLGLTKMPLSEFRTFIEGIAAEYHGDTYHLITKNCNHFTDDVSGRLAGKRIPGWVNRLARVEYKNVTFLTFSGRYGLYPMFEWLPVVIGSVCSCLLPESLQVTTVKQLPEYHECVEDTESVSTATPRESASAEDTDQEKYLLSPSAVIGDVSFVKETSKENLGEPMPFLREVQTAS